MNNACGNTVSGISSGATKLDCAKEGVRALLDVAQPVQRDPGELRLRSSNGNVAQPARRGFALHVPGDHQPECVHARLDEHRSNISLELGCPGNLTATPSWYKPTTGTLNEIDQVTVKATSGSFFLQYPVGGTKTANIAYNAGGGTASAQATVILNALNAIPGLSGNVTVATIGSQPSNTYAWSITFINALGGQNLNNELAAGLAASPNQLKLSGGTPSHCGDDAPERVDGLPDLVPQLQRRQLPVRLVQLRELPDRSALERLPRRATPRRRW